jgi:hypothetical protein
MRFFDIEQKKGWAAVFLATLGAIILGSSVFLLVLNNEFSAFGFAEISGGNIVPIEGNIYGIGVDITSGGAFGLTAGLVASIIVTAVQFIFWVLDPNIVFKQEDGFRRIIYGLIAYDIFSTIYYLSQYVETTTYLFPFGEIVFLTLKGGVTILGITFITIAFLSVGSEFWLALGLTLLRINAQPAWEQMQEWFASIESLFSKDYTKNHSKRVDSKIDDYKREDQFRRNNEKPNPNRPNQQNFNSRPQPRDGGYREAPNGYPQRDSSRS